MMKQRFTHAVPRDDIRLEGEEIAAFVATAAGTPLQYSWLDSLETFYIDWELIWPM